MKKRIFVLSVLAATLVSGCNQLPAPAQGDDDLATVVAATLAAGQPADNHTSTVAPASTQKVVPTETSVSHDQPSLSMDAYLLVYTHDGNVWTMAADGKTQQLITAGDVVDVLLSDDRQIVTYVRQTFQPQHFEVRAISTDGSNDRQILSQAALDSLYPLDGPLHYLTSQMEFIPGSHTLLFNTRAVFDGPGLVKNDDLYKLNLDTGERSQILTREKGGDFEISPDGKYIAIARADSIAIAAIDGTNLRPDLVTFQPVITYSEYQYYPVLVWAPDSSRFGVLLPSTDPLVDNPSGTVWIVPVDGTPQSFQSIQEQVFFPQTNGQSLLSPDLQKVAFLHSDGQDQATTLLVANVDGSSSQVYDQGDLQWVGWTPDGFGFAYLREGVNLTFGRNGSAPQPLAEGRVLRWLTDRLYLAQSGQYGDWTLKLGEIGGAAVRLVQPVSASVVFDIR